MVCKGKFLLEMDDDWGVPPFMETPIWIHLVSVSFCVGKSEHLGRRHAGRNICRCVWIIPYSGKWQHDLPIPEVSHLQSTVSRTFSSCVDFFLRRRFPCHFNFYHHPPILPDKKWTVVFLPISGPTNGTTESKYVQMLNFWCKKWRP